MKFSLTSEIGVNTVSVAKIAQNGIVNEEKVAGLEWGPPTLGLPYVIYLGKGKYMKTSPVKELKEIHNALMFKTSNSVYRIEYMEKEKTGDMKYLTETLTHQSLAQERIERELELASEIQSRLLPREMPEVPGLTLAGFSSPAYIIGGDYFDILHVDADHLGLFIADVSGKGIPAALLSMITRSYLHVSYPGESDPSRILSELNDLLLKDIDQRQYVTAMYAIHDTRSRELRISNAGHNPALILREASGTIRRVHTKGRPLGIFPHALFENSCEQLEAGDVFCLYTDGLPEAKNRRLEHFGLDRLEETLLSRHEGTAGEIAEGILEALRQFVGDAVQHDDLALIVLKVV